MNTPISWIKAYVPDLDVTAQEFVDAMTLSGSHVEGYEQKDKNLDKIVVGKILTMENPALLQRGQVPRPARPGGRSWPEYLQGAGQPFRMANHIYRQQSRLWSA